MSGANVSPTAHYTGYVWARNGLSHPELETRRGRGMYEAMRPTMLLSEQTGGPTLENYLLTRHLAIDGLLERSIDAGEVTQVIEVAAGLSPRGWRFTERYGERITYIETDLAGMAQRKAGALQKMGSLGPHHRVAVLDALSDRGPESLAVLAGELDQSAGLAIITEGLLGYLDGDAVGGLFRRFARVLGGFAAGRYLSDIHLGDVQNTTIRAFRSMLSLFVRGGVYLHFDDARGAESALLAAGFAVASVRRASELAPQVSGSGRELAHILEASTR